jgi:hypothetical protein
MERTATQVRELIEGAGAAGAAGAGFSFSFDSRLALRVYIFNFRSLTTTFYLFDTTFYLLEPLKMHESLLEILLLFALCFCSFTSIKSNLYATLRRAQIRLAHKFV